MAVVQTLASKAKAIAALIVTGIGEAVNEGLLTGSAQKWGHVVVVVLTAATVYLVPNA